MKVLDVLQRPLITEKAARCQQTANEYCFQVHPKANKHQIRRAVEQLFQVHVVGVKTLTVPGKRKKAGRYVAQSSDWKKAIVKLHEKDTIKMFEGK